MTQMLIGVILTPCHRFPTFFIVILYGGDDVIPSDIHIFHCFSQHGLIISEPYTEPMYLNVHYNSSHRGDFKDTINNPIIPTLLNSTFTYHVPMENAVLTDTNHSHFILLSH